MDQQGLSEKIIPEIKSTRTRKLVGMHKPVSVAEFGVTGLWRSFMPRKGEIQNTVSDELISVSIYDPSYFNEFDPDRQFEKWAAVEVSELKDIPGDMSSLILPAGLYAVFRYKGPSSDPSIFQFIYGTWLPGSAYELDHRPHFEILGVNYRIGDANSEEEIWVPVYKDGPLRREPHGLI